MQCWVRSFIISSEGCVLDEEFGCGRKNSRGKDECSSVTTILVQPRGYQCSFTLKLHQQRPSTSVIVTMLLVRHYKSCCPSVLNIKVCHYHYIALILFTLRCNPGILCGSSFITITLQLRDIFYETLSLLSNCTLLLAVPRKSIIQKKPRRNNPEKILTIQCNVSLGK